ERDVRLAHELLDAQRPGRILVAEGRRKAALVVESHAVVAPAGGVVELVAQFPQPVARRPRRLHFAHRQQAALAGLAEPRHLVAGARDPERGLEIAQSTLALLDVRLEQPDRSSVAGAPAAPLLELLLDELLDLARVELGDDGPLQSLEKARPACHQPAI